jgi:O-antigen ligase
MFSTHPWAGVGAGNFARHYFEYANVVGSPEYDFHPAGTTEYPHGLWLEIASETGIIGLLTFGSAIVAAFVSLSKARSTFLMRGETSHAAIATGIGIALVGYLVASGFLHETYLRYVGLYVGLVAGIARLAHDDVREDAV